MAITTMGNEGYVNYYDRSMEIISSLKEGERPSLLFHVCCGPCAGWPLLFLAPHFDITIYFTNSNIYPESEFYKRLDNLKILLEGIKKDHGYDIKLIVPEYDHESFMKDLREYASAPEGGERCWICYRKRMKEAYDFAEEKGFDYFTTVMTVSREKPSQILNFIGSELEKEHAHTKYLYSDFKKKDGFNKTVEVRKRYDLYYQLYCGCEYSLENSLKWQASKSKNSPNKN